MQVALPSGGQPRLASAYVEDSEMQRRRQPSWSGCPLAYCADIKQRRLTPDSQSGCPAAPAAEGTLSRKYGNSST